MTSESGTERREWPSEEEFDGTTVGATPKGANYHDDRDCRHLDDRKVVLHDKSAAWYKGLDPCGDCGTWPKHELDVATDGGSERSEVWDPDRVVEAEMLLDRELTQEERTALQYHEPLPESLPEEVRERV